DRALCVGARSLPGGDTLARLLQRERSHRNRGSLRSLDEDQIAAWARAHHARTGLWPMCHSGEVVDAPGETWGSIDTSLREGLRGLPGGSSLALLLERRFGVRPRTQGRQLCLRQILEWADFHFARTGKWPRHDTGSIPGTQETWAAVEAALVAGHRGL